MQTSFDILELAKIISALGIILGLIIGAYKIYDKITDKQEAHDRELVTLKEKNEELRKEKESEIKKINKENTLMCYALHACLDGLEQLGANHTVPEAKRMLEKHLNKAAHDEE